MSVVSSTRRVVLTSVLLVVLATVSTITTLALKYASEQAYDARSDVQEIALDIHAVDGWRWRATASTDDVPKVRRALQPVLDDLGAQVDHVAGEHLVTNSPDQLVQRIEDYLAVVDTAFDLAESRTGPLTAAEQQVIDERLDQVQEALNSEDDWLALRAEQRQLLSNVVLVLTVLGTIAACIALLAWRARLDSRQAEERRVGERSRALVDQTVDLVLVVDPHGRLRFLSPSARSFATARRPDLGRLRSLTELAHPGDADDVAALLAATPDGTVRRRLRLGSLDGWRSFEVSARNLVDDTNIGGIVLTAHDVTEQETLQSELHHLALHDALTGLPNRVLLRNRIDEALGAATGPIGLMLIDLDRFKEINDTLGHHMGDLLLTQVAPRLTSLIYPGDTVARLGGDEFAVLIQHGGTLADVCELAETICLAISQPYPVDSLELKVEASVGVVVSGEHGDDADTLLQRADVAMYVAKRRHIGVFAYDATADTYDPDRISLLSDLRRALDRDELVLHFQPQLCLQTRRLRGVEALVRWQHPERGLLHPDAFLPVAESSGLIGRLTERVLEVAAARAAAWRDAGQDLQVAVNLSPRNLLGADFESFVTDLLARHGLPAERLVLEVTESTIMSEPLRAVEVLTALDRQGFGLSIDDFGVGYTSLAQLKHLPMHELKIDRSFVMTMMRDRSNWLIVRSVVDLGHNLGLRTVAEGVQDAETLHALTELGCDLAQGYYIAHPMPVEAFDAWRSQHRTDRQRPPPLPRPRAADQGRQAAEPPPP